MADFDRYLSDLAAQLRERPSGATKLKLRTLLGKFGYQRRGQVAVDRIHQALRASGLEAEFGVDFPPSLDERVLVRAVGVPCPPVIAESEHESTVMEPVKPRSESGREGTHHEPSCMPADASAPELDNQDHNRLLPKTAPRRPLENPASPISEVKQLDGSGTRTTVPIAAPTPLPATPAARRSELRPFAAFARRLVGAAMSLLTIPLRSPKEKTGTDGEKRSHEGSEIEKPLPAQPDLRQVAEAAIAATVVIETEGGIGSGFFVHPTGLLVTARHVVEERGVSCRKVGLRFRDDLQASAVVFRSHPRLDYALAWANLDGVAATLALGNPRRLRHADTLLAVGHPSSLRFTVSRGVVSNPASTIRGIDYIQTDTAIDPGNSGGPLLNGHGRVVGVNVWGFMGLGAGRFALPIDYLVADVRRALAVGRQKCLSACYCRLCGFTHFQSEPWFCENCGTQSREYLGIADQP